MQDEAYYLAKAARLRDVAANLAELEPDVAQAMLDMAEKFEADARNLTSE